MSFMCIYTLFWVYKPSPTNFLLGLISLEDEYSQDSDIVTPWNLEIKVKENFAERFYRTHLWTIRSSTSPSKGAIETKLYFSFMSSYILNQNAVFHIIIGLGSANQPHYIHYTLPCLRARIREE